MSHTDYLKIRAANAPVALDAAAALTVQFPGHAGKIVEVQGTVTGLFASEKTSAFLLRTKQETVLVSFTQPDGDIAVDTTLRVLAMVPASGVILHSVAATPVTESAARAVATNYYRVPDADTTNTSADGYTYAQAPPLTPQTRPATPTTVVANDSLANQPAIVAVYAARMQQLNKNLNADTARTIAYHLLTDSAANGVDPRLVFALVTAESRFNPRAVSRCGAMGLGQLMPGTAAALGVAHPFDIAENLDGSVRYLAGQLQRFGHITLALAAYNAGPNRVANCGYQVPPISETKNYVAYIWRNYARLAGFDPDSDGPVASN